MKPTALLTALALALAMPAIAHAQNQTGAKTSPMVTPWAADAAAGKGWTEYPRPQMTRPAWQNLNGHWDYAITPVAAPAPAKYEGKILVPFCVESKLSGVNRDFMPDQRLWYHRTFTIPADWAGQRVLLHFGAVDYEAHVFVNGAIVGSHKGGNTPFSFDITPFLKTGSGAAGAQTIVVAVTDPSSTGEQPRGKQRLEQSGIWYTPVSGIWQTVWLEPVPAEIHIASIKCEPDLDNSRITLTPMGNITAPEGKHYAVRARVLDGGKVIAEAAGRLSRSLAISIPNPKTWSPDTPHLYDLQVDLYEVNNPFDLAAAAAAAKGKKKGGKDKGAKGGIPVFFGPEEQKFYSKIPAGAKSLDTVKGYFAMRKISLGPGPKGVVMHLNNKPLYHLGPLDQGYWPDGLLTPPTEAAMRFDIDFLKRAGFNMLRKHIKIEPALYYAHCDKIGMLVWQDMPSGMFYRERRDGNDRQHVLEAGQLVTDGDSYEIKKLPSAAALYEHELREMIDALHAFPSIVMWVPFNEGWGQYDSVRIANAVKALDPARLVNGTSGWLDTGASDILDYHDYAPVLRVNKLVRDNTKRALVLGEFGGIGFPVEGHLWWTNRRNWGYNQNMESAKQLEEQYRKRMEQLRDISNNTGMCAGVYTQTTDVEGEVNGLLTYDRRVEKIPAKKLAEIHKSLGLY